MIVIDTGDIFNLMNQMLLGKILSKYSFILVSTYIIYFYHWNFKIEFKTDYLVFISSQW